MYPSTFGDEMADVLTFTVILLGHGYDIANKAKTGRALKTNQTKNI